MDGGVGGMGLKGIGHGGDLLEPRKAMNGEQLQNRFFNWFRSRGDTTKAANALACTVRA